MVRRLRTPPLVVAEEEGEAAGMASMVADLIEANMAESLRRARAAAGTQGSVVLCADDQALAVTVSFGRERVSVVGSSLEGAAVLAGSWTDMARVCSGRCSPARAVLRRKLRVQLRRPLRPLLVAAYVLKVPRSTYSKQKPSR